MRRSRRTRAKISGTAQAPRLAVFRSNRHLYAQLIDDTQGHTLVSASTRELEKSPLKKDRKIGQSQIVGEKLAKKALAVGVKAALFDRRHYKYHGRVKAVADAVKSAGLKI